MREVTDQMHRTLQVPDRPERIISLVPSQTELLHDLGLGERVVGITKFCIHPEAWFRSKVRVGGTKQVDLDKVRALKPDLIIGNKEENSQADIEALEKEFPVWMSDVKSLHHAGNMILRVGDITGTTAAADSLVHAIAAAFGGLRTPTAQMSAAYFIWRDPLMVAGGDTFISDMMRRAGFSNVFTHRKERYAEITPAELAAADPDVILLSSEPYPFAEKHILEFNMLCPGTPVHLVDGELFSWYGSRMLQAPAYFNGLLAGWTV
jgi:ABC-type Fe3+-hydroxamate transport system substrate-binding protein